MRTILILTLDESQRFASTGDYGQSMWHRSPAKGSCFGHFYTTAALCHRDWWVDSGSASSSEFWMSMARAVCVQKITVLAVGSGALVMGSGLSRFKTQKARDARALELTIQKIIYTSASPVSMFLVSQNSFEDCV